VTADKVTMVMMELKEEFGVADSEIHVAIAASPQLAEIWPPG
jgi:hypothetical protein